MFPQYSPQKIEPKWQRTWEETGLYHANEGGNKPKFYCLDFFPYPSGDWLHVGHCRNYIPTDVISRFIVCEVITCCTRWVGMLLANRLKCMR
jgi:leucyl-tRNA synthetase